MITDLLLLRPGPFRHACEAPRAPAWMAAFLLGTGALYGLLVAAFQVRLGGPLQGVPVERIPGSILYGGNLLSGILVALVFHGGATLVVWLMARAVGGPGRLPELYRVTAYLLPLAAPALPYLAGHAASGGPPAPELPLAAAYLPLACLGAALGLAGLYRALRVTQGTGPARTALAVALFALFSGSILLL
ncbi:MAG: hypothetical protein Kow0092_05490 [Deferrisomatales bacterium]